MKRPWISKSIAELEALFEAARGDLNTLDGLADELRNRTTQRASQLARKVNALRMKPKGEPPETRREPKVSQAPLVLNLPEKPVQQTPASSQAREQHHFKVRNPTDPAPKTERGQKQQPATRPDAIDTPRMPPQAPGSQRDRNRGPSPVAGEAYRTLRIRPGAGWPEIEMARRQLVDRYKPTDSLVDQETAAERCRAINEAAAVIWEMRHSDCQ